MGFYEIPSFYKSCHLKQKLRLKILFAIQTNDQLLLICHSLRATNYFSRARAAFTHVLYILPKFGVYNQMRKSGPRITRFKMAASCELWILWNHCCFPCSDASGTQIALIVLPDCINCSSRRTKVNDIYNCAFSAFRIALIQLAVSSNKAQNLLRAKDKIKEAVSKGAKIVALPVSMILPVFTWRH